MNIYLLNDSFPPLIDGVANTVLNYAETLKNRGDNTIVITPENPDAQGTRYDFPILRYSGIDVRDLVGYVAGYPFSPYVIGELKRYGQGMLHSHCPFSSTTLARSIKDQLDSPLVMTYHTKFDVDIAKAVKSKLLQEGAIKAIINNINACDEVWVVSRGAGENLKSLGYQGDYVVMENGVDIPRGRLPEDDYMKRTEHCDLPKDVPVFLFVGRIMWYKGLKIIIDALSGLNSQGVDFRMVFVGGGSDKDEVENYIRKKRLENKIIFTGPIYDRDNLCAWYCRADLFLFPSGYDTNGLVVREAAACGLPSVLIEGSCAAEGVTDRGNGFLIEENAASMAVLLAQISHDKKLLRTIGEKASKELYISWEQSISKARDRYEIVMENYKRGLYPKQISPSNEFFRLQGNIMDMFSELQTFMGRYL